MSINLQTEYPKLTLDFNQKSCKTVIAKQYDKNSRFVPIQCTNNGIPFLLDSSFSIQVKTLTADNRALLENSAAIQSDGTILLKLTENMLMSGGRSNVEINIYDIKNQKRLSPMNFYLLVEASPYDEDRIISSDEFSALSDLYFKSEGLINTVNEHLVDTNAHGYGTRIDGLSDKIESMSNEVYTTTATPPSGQKDGDYWTRLL